MTGSKALPGVLRWNLGDLTVTALNDGWFPISLDLVTNIARDDAVALQRAGHRTEEPKATLNAFLITGPDRKAALIDTGYGKSGPGRTGRLPAALAAAEIGADEIETILISHLHPDHFGGLSPDGTAAFPNAEVVIHETEAAYWLPDEALARAPEATKAYFEGARKAVAPYAGRLREHVGGEVLPGITAVLLPGHTPGHCGFRIVSGDKSLLMWTDLIHVPAIQFKNPDASMAFDADRDQARETRRRILDEVATDGTLIAGSHLEFPALGTVARDGAGYSFVPVLWNGGEA